MYSEIFKTLNTEELTLILMDIPPGGYKNWAMFTSGRKFYDGNEDQFFYEGEPIVCPLMN